MQFMLLLIILPSFAFFGIESYLRMDSKVPPVAKVAGQTITQPEWDAAQARQVEPFRQVFGEQFNPAMLDNVHVDYYGTSMPLSQVSNISAPDPRTLQIQPWEKSMIHPIEKAIMAHKLRLYVTIGISF